MKYLLPISCFLLLGVGLWQVAVQRVVAPYFQYALAGVCFVLFVWLLVKVVATPSRLPASGVPSLWNPSGPPHQDLVGKA